MKRVGLVLGSGAARGWSHIGVIEALDEAGIRAELVAGTSIGSVVGAAYAMGRIGVLKEAALSLDWKRMMYYMLDLKRLRSGLVDGERVKKFLGESLEPQRIESLPIPYRCVATDAVTGEAVVFAEGDLLEASRASISIPGIFTPVWQDNRTLIDGGVVNPLPVDEVQDMGADFVIAVDINHGRTGQTTYSTPTNYLTRVQSWSAEQAGKRGLGFMERISARLEAFDPERLGDARQWIAPDPMPHIFDIIGNSIRIMEEQIAEANLKLHRPDVLIRPRVSDFGVMDFHRAGEAMEQGYRAGRAAVGEIEQKLELAGG